LACPSVSRQSRRAHVRDGSMVAARAHGARVARGFMAPTAQQAVTQSVRMALVKATTTLTDTGAHATPMPLRLARWRGVVHHWARLITGTDAVGSGQQRNMKLARGVLSPGFMRGGFKRRGAHLRLPSSHLWRRWAAWCTACRRTASQWAPRRAQTARPRRARPPPWCRRARRADVRRPLQPAHVSRACWRMPARGVMSCSRGGGAGG
jgi:hypothetical protein